MNIPHDLKTAILQYCLSPDRVKGIVEDFDGLSDLGEQHGWSELREAIAEFITTTRDTLVNPRPMDRTQPPPGWTPGPHGTAGRGVETGEVGETWERYLAEQEPLATENAVLRTLILRASDHYDMCAERDMDGFQEWLSDATDFLRQHQEGYEEENGTALSDPPPAVGKATKVRREDVVHFPYIPNTARLRKRLSAAIAHVLEEEAEAHSAAEQLGEE